MVCERGTIGYMTDAHDSHTTAQAYVVAGPSGVGKGTILASLCDRAPECWLSISATTRSPRPGEIDGVHYFFLTEKEFDRLLAEGNMLEWAVVHGKHRYGTPRGPVEDALAHGKTVILEVDLDGARQIRSSMPQVRQIFIAPPSFDVLERRLRSRATETEEQIRRRLETARVELAAADEFDIVLVNDSVARATDELLHICGLSK